MIKKNFPTKQHHNKVTSPTHLDCIVDFELHGKVQYGVIRKDLGKKFQIETEHEEYITLGEDRIYIYTEKKCGENIQQLKQFALKIRDTASRILLAPLWEICKDKKTPIPFSEITQAYSYVSPEKNEGNPHSLTEVASLRHALLLDKIYFKRELKNFIPRTLEEIQSAKAVSEENVKQEAEALSLMLVMRKRLHGDMKAQFPQTIEKLLYIAALGKKYSDAKFFVSLIESLSKDAGINDKKIPIEEKAFILLTKTGYIDEKFNLTPFKLGRPISFSTEERDAAERIHQQQKNRSFEGRENIENLFVCTVDSETTQDFDDAISFEETSTGTRVGVHITDVSAHIDRNDVLESTAKRRATSIYCPDIIYPMLPLSLSEGVLSLKEGFTRPCISFFVTLSPSGSIIHREIKRTLARVHRRFSYDEIDAALENNTETEPFSIFTKLIAITTSLEQRRVDQGAILFPRRDLTPELRVDGKVQLVSNSDDTPARKMISELMILANETAALFADEQGLPFLYRTQPHPEGNIEETAMRVPEGPAREYARRSLLKRSEVKTTAESHSSLGVSHYCQVTSPIRRFVDLILIRQISFNLADNSTLYSKSDLENILKEIEPHLDEASLIQRDRNRYWLLRYIEQQKLTMLQGTVVKLDGPRPLAEIDNMNCIFSFQTKKDDVDFRKRLALGDKISLKITKLIPQRDKLYLQEVES